ANERRLAGCGGIGRRKWILLGDDGFGFRCGFFVFSGARACDEPRSGSDRHHALYAISFARQSIHLLTLRRTSTERTNLARLDHGVSTPTPIGLLTRIRGLTRCEEILSQRRGDAEIRGKKKNISVPTSASPRLCESSSSDESSRSHALTRSSPTSGAGKRMPGLRLPSERRGKVSHFPRTAVGAAGIQTKTRRAMRA